MFASTSQDSEKTMNHSAARSDIGLPSTAKLAAIAMRAVNAAAPIEFEKQQSYSNYATYYCKKHS